MGSSPPERRPVAPGDFEALAEVVRSGEAALGRRPTAGAGDLREWSSAVELDPDSILLAEGGEPVAFGWLFVRDDVAYAYGAVHPAAQGRGLGSELATFAEQRARERRAHTIRTDVPGDDERAAELFRQRGYAPVRRFCELALELAEPPPLPVWPAGGSVEAFRREHAEEFHALIEEAFAGDWGFVPLPFDEWLRLRVDGADTSLCFLARVDGELAGVIRCEPERHGVGWVGALAVRERWRGRGIGRALLLHAFGAFYERGRRRVGLGVDADNATGAMRLYQSVGMTVVAEELVVERALA